MNKKLLPSLIIPSAAGIVFLIIGYFLSPRINPYYAGLPQITKYEAERIVENFAASQNFALDGYFTETFFSRDVSGMDYLVRTKGLDSTIALASEEVVPLAYWETMYYKNTPRDNQEEFYRFRISPSGKLVSFQHVIPDSASGDSLSAADANALAQQYLQSWPEINPGSFELESSARVKKTNRIDYSLSYTKKSARLGDGVEVLRVQIAGNEVASVRWGFREPSDFLTTSGVVGGANLLFNSASVLAYVIVSVLALFAFLKLYHAGLISVKNGMMLGAVLYSVVVLILLNNWDVFDVGTNLGAISKYYTKLILLGAQIVTQFTYMFVNVATAWSAGHYHARLQKPALLSGIDSLLNREWFTKNIGREIPVGVAAGTILFGAVVLLNYILVTGFGAQPRLTFGGQDYFSHFLPVVGILLNALFFALYYEVVFRKFLITFFNRMLKSPGGAIGLSAVLFSLFSVFFNDQFAFWPSYFTLLPYFLIGLVQGYVFWRFGLLASMTSGIFYVAYTAVGPMWATGVPTFSIRAVVCIALFVGVLIWGLLALFRGKQLHFAAEEEPAHIKRIKEQTRMQKELEIARKVQLGLLPKSNPNLAGFDISGVCIPAQEVGGDYFDFIKLKNGKLGIAVADVSGKGVPAAIYMTLTKGILQSHAEGELSPKEVLSKVNNLMYRTIERSWYVSMFYAVLDAQNNMMRFARAGHNPAIVLNKTQEQPQLLQTAGIGLGLDIGEIFTKTLVEGEMQLAQGDTLVFYTDGFTEAMNSNGDEFGEDRFLDLLKTTDNGSAEGLLKEMVSTVRDFAGSAPQHDDMTMVVLKV